MRVSYAMNAYVAPGFPLPYTHRFSEVRNADRTALVADVAYQHNHPSISNQGANNVGYKHGADANYLFMDSHVETLRLNRTAEIIFSF